MTQISSPNNSVLVLGRTLVESDDIAAATVIRHPFLSQDSPPVRVDETDCRIGQFTPLDFGEDAGAGLMSVIDSSTRRNIRKAEKEGEGVGVTEADGEGAADRNPLGVDVLLIGPLPTPGVPSAGAPPARRVRRWGRRLPRAACRPTVCPPFRG